MATKLLTTLWAGRIGPSICLLLGGIPKHAQGKEDRSRLRFESSAGALSRGRLRRCTQAIVFFRLEEVQMDIRLLVVSTVVGVGATLHESSEGPLAERGIGPMKVVHGWGREFARVGSILAFCAAAALGNPQNAIADSINLTVRRGNVMTDQANLVSTSNSVVGDSQFLQQTFTVGTAGTLTGIQFAPLR